MTSLPDVSIEVVGTQGGSLFLAKQNDPDILELVQVQRDDRFRKFRRAYPASALGARPGVTFCEITRKSDY